jgi:hypothetical protein
MTEPWIDATYDTLFFDGWPPHTGRACQVLFDGGHIQVRYVDGEGNTVQFVGTEKGPGHFELTARKADGDSKATLHKFAASNVLEGSWYEGNVHGMWRIRMTESRPG